MMPMCTTPCGSMQRSPPEHRRHLCQQRGAARMRLHEICTEKGACLGQGLQASGRGDGGKGHGEASLVCYACACLGMLRMLAKAAARRQGRGHMGKGRMGMFENATATGPAGMGWRSNELCVLSNAAGDRPCRQGRSERVSGRAGIKEGVQGKYPAW